jgi:hypothetical protein
MPTIIPREVIAEHGKTMIRLLNEAKREVRAQRRSFRDYDRARILAYIDKRIAEERKDLKHFLGAKLPVPRKTTDH